MSSALPVKRKTNQVIGVKSRSIPDSVAIMKHDRLHSLNIAHAKSRHKVGLKTGNFNFHIFTSMIWLVIVLMCWLVIKVTLLTSEQKSSRIVANCVELYTLVIRSWNIHSAINVNIQELLLPHIPVVLDRSAALANIKIHYTEFTEDIIPRFQSLRDADFGEFQDRFEFLASNYTVCSDAISNYPDLYAKCAQGSTAFMEGNVLFTLKHFAALIDSIFQTYSLLTKHQQSLPSDSLATILRQEEVKMYLFYGGFTESLGLGMMSVIYYAYLMGLAVYLDKLLSVPKSLQDFISVNIPLALLLLVLIHVLFTRRIFRVPSRFSFIPLLFSLELIASNSLSVSKLKSMSD